MGNGRGVEEKVWSGCEYVVVREGGIMEEGGMNNWEQLCELEPVSNQLLYTQSTGNIYEMVALKTDSLTILTIIGQLWNILDFKNILFGYSSHDIWRRDTLGKNKLASDWVLVFRCFQIMQAVRMRAVRIKSMENGWVDTNSTMDGVKWNRLRLARPTQ